MEKKILSFVIFESIDKPFVVLTLQKMTGFDCLARTNDDGGGVFSSDFICRGGTGGAGDERFVEFISINITIFHKKKNS